MGRIVKHGRASHAVKAMQKFKEHNPKATGEEIRSFCIGFRTGWNRHYEYTINPVIIARQQAKKEG